DLVPELRKARSTLIDAMRQTVEGNAEARAALEKAEAFYHEGSQRLHPLLLQISRKDGPIPAEDIAPRVLSEDLETIRAVVSGMPDAARLPFREEAESVAASAVVRGYPAA